jgi:hypothetical protein
MDDGFDMDRADLDDRAVAHAPRGRDEIRVAVAELRARGLTARDIASILGIAPSQVEQLLGERVQS